MRKFQYIEPLHDHHDEAMIITVSETWIILMYFPYWCSRMRGVGKAHLIALENCIDDFCVTNWAVEL